MSKFGNTEERTATAGNRRRGAFAALLAAGLAVAAPMNVRASTPVSGAITQNTTWTVAGAPYVLSGAVTVENGAFLRIDPGVRVLMEPAASLRVANGALSAQGTLQQPIVVTSAHDVVGSPTQAQPGDWGTLAFDDATNDANTALAHVQVRYGHGIVVASASPRIDDVAIDNHDAAAITIDLASSPSGRGLSASGNTLNGISVPAGAVVGDVAWRLKGIPYVVTQGLVEVGLPPFGFVPATLELTSGEAGALTLNVPDPAPAGGLAVALSSNAANVASVASQVVVPAGEHTASVAVTAGSVGQADVTATATGYAPASARVTVVAQPSLSLAPSGVAVGPGRTKTLTVSRSSNLGTALSVTLASLSPSVATVPAGATIASGATSATFDVTGVAAGTATIRASAAGYGNGETQVTVAQPTLTAPPTVFVAPGLTTNVTVTLSDPAPAGGVTLTVSNGNPTSVGAPASVSVAQGASSTQVALIGVADTTTPATLTFAATGYTSASTQVTVRRIVPHLGDDALTLPQGTTLNLPVVLSAPAPTGGVTIALTALTPGIVDIEPAQVTIAQGQTASSDVTISGTAAGATIVALRSVDAVGIDGTAAVTVEGAAQVAFLGETSPLTLGKGLKTSFAVGLVGEYGASRRLERPLTIALTNPDPTRLSMPSQVTLPANAAQVQFAVEALETTTQNVLIGAQSATAQDGIAAAQGLSTGVVVPQLAFSGADAMEVGGSRYGFGMSWNVRGTIAGTGRSIELSIVDSSPAGIVDGFYDAASGSTTLQSVTQERTVYVGSATVAGSLKIRAAVQGVGTWTSAAIQAVGPRFSFDDASIALGQGLTARPSLVIRFGDDRVFRPLPSDFAVTSTDPTKVQVGTIQDDSAGHATIELIGVAPTAAGQPVAIRATAAGYATGGLPVTVAAQQLALENLDGVRSVYDAADDFSVCWGGDGNPAASTNQTVDVAIAAGASAGVLPNPPLLDTNGTGATSVVIAAGQRCGDLRVAAPLARGSYQVTASIAGGTQATSATQVVTGGHVQFDVYEGSYVPVGKRLTSSVTLYLRDAAGQSAAATEATTIALTNHGPAWVSVPASVVVAQGQSSVTFDIAGIESSTEAIAVDAYAPGAVQPSATLLVRVREPTLRFQMALGRPSGDTPSAVTIASEFTYPCSADGVPNDEGPLECPGSGAMAAAQTFAIAAISDGTAVIPGFLASAGGASVATIAFDAGADTSTTVYAATPTRNGSYRVRLTQGSETWTSDPVYVDAVEVGFGRTDPFPLGAGLVASEGLSVSLSVHGHLVALPTPVVVQLACANAARCSSVASVTIPAGEYGAPVQITGLATGSTTLTATASGMPAIVPAAIDVVEPSLHIYVHTQVVVGSTLPFNVAIEVPGASYQQLAAQPIAFDLESAIPATATVPSTATIAVGMAGVEGLGLAALRTGTTAIVASGANLRPATSAAITVTPF